MTNGLRSLLLVPGVLWCACGAKAVAHGSDHASSDAGTDAGESIDTARYSGASGSWARTFPSGYGALLAAGANGALVVAIPGLRPIDQATSYRLPADVMRLDPDTGATIWSRRFYAVESVAVDPSGGSAVVSYAGNYVSEMPFVLTRLDPSGREIWSRPLVADGYRYQHADIAFDRGGNLIIARDVLSEACCTLDAPAPTGYVDLEKIDAAGAQVFRRQFGDGTSYLGNAFIALDASDNIRLFAANVNRSIDFGGGAEVFGADGPTCVVAGYDPSGRHVWHRSLGSTWNAGGRPIAVDAAGGLVVAGSLASGSKPGFDFGLGPFACSSGSGFLLGLSPDGAPLWNRCLEKFDSPGVGARPTGAIVVGSVASGTQVGGPVLNPDTSGDGLLAYYDSTGAWLGQDATTEPGMQTFGPVIADAKGTVFLGGTFDARFTLPGMMTLEPFEPLGEMTTFVARLAPRP